MNTFQKQLTNNLTAVKTALPSEDILSFSFETGDGVPCAVVYADGMVHKELLGTLVIRPLSLLHVKQDGRMDNSVQISTRFPEFKIVESMQQCTQEILDGNTLLLVDGVSVGFIIGAKTVPTRAVVEPPTDIAVKGPREGFIEDVKVNMALIRKRLKTPELRFETLRVGRRSDTAVVLCWLDGISQEKTLQAVKEKIQAIDVDIIPDSSYISAWTTQRHHSIFRTVGTTEKPDIFCAKIAEGRVGIIVDGSPIALTLPYLFMEDLQSSEDYFISPFMATIVRAMRFFALFIAVLLPAFYVSAELFKMQLLPLGLMLTIASSVRELPLSPGMEMFIVLLLLEILKEASIRMPKYVGMSLSVVGALVLGETAVRAGFLSTPAIIIVAFSGICMYTVPNFVETGSLLRWIFLLVGGSLGPFGIVLFSVFLLCYLVDVESLNAPLLAPFSPLIPRDLKDSAIKYGMQNLAKRPNVLRPKNKTRFKGETV